MPHSKFEVLPRGLKINDWEILHCELEYTHSGRTLYPVKCSCGRRYFRFKRDIYRHQSCIHCSQKRAGITKRKIKSITRQQRVKIYNRWFRLRNKSLLCEEWFDFDKFCEYIITLEKWEEPRAILTRVDDSKLFEPGNVKFN